MAGQIDTNARDAIYHGRWTVDKIYFGVVGDIFGSIFEAGRNRRTDKDSLGDADQLGHSHT